MPFLCAGDQNPRSQAASNCDAWNSGTEEPADRKGEKDPAPGGISVLPWRLKKNSGHCGSLNLTNAWWSVPAAQHDYEKSRARHDQEEKLIISAWYNMVSECRHVFRRRFSVILRISCQFNYRESFSSPSSFKAKQGSLLDKTKVLILYSVHPLLCPHLIHHSFFVCLSLSQGMALHQKVSGERVGPSNQAMSFLAQQRQSTNAKRGLTRHHPR